MTNYTMQPSLITLPFLLYIYYLQAAIPPPGEPTSGKVSNRPSVIRLPARLPTFYAVIAKAMLQSWLIRLPTHCKPECLTGHRPTP